MESTFNSLGDNHYRLTQAEKNANNNQWYKDRANLLDNHSITNNSLLFFDGETEFKRIKVNYDLFNNIINLADFKYVCKPFGEDTGELPANFTNRDIVSTKIKVLLGMEMGMPFSWKVVATNPEATTRREEAEASEIRQFVIDEIMTPIRKNISLQSAEKTKGQKLTPQEQEQIQQDIDSEVSSQTPDEVRRYTHRKRQDPVEVLNSQILEYLMLKEKIPDKFNKGWKHANLSGKEVYCVTERNGEPALITCNSLYFDCDKSPDLDNIQDGEWATMEYRMHPSQVVALDSDNELTPDEIDRIYQFNQNPTTIRDEDFTFENGRQNHAYTVRVKHITFKALAKVGFLKYFNKAGEQTEMIVDETYKLNQEAGDIEIEWQWIPETHECYKILNNIFIQCRPVDGQFRDLDTIWDCKLPYFGNMVDNMNSPITCNMERMKAYQYFYDILIYRIELLLASDEGKKIVFNINAIPKSAGVSMEQWMYFMKANNIIFANPNEEGNRGGGDVTNMAKEIDMSMVSNIDNYIKLAEYTDVRCGLSIGVTKQMEAQISDNEAVNNTKQNIIQASTILKPYFELHNSTKCDVLQALVDKAKLCYSKGKPRKLTYILDDMSLRMIDLSEDNMAMLSSSTIGIFVANASKADEAKRAIIGLSQAALQNQQMDLVDVAKIIRSESITEAEELLEASADKKQAQLQQGEIAKLKQQKEIEDKADQLKRDEWEHEKDMIILKEGERRKTEVEKSAVVALGFAQDKDANNNGTPDVLDIAKHGLDALTKGRQLDQNDEKLSFEKDKFAHQQKMDAEKNKIEKEKLKNKPKT